MKMIFFSLYVNKTGCNRENTKRRCTDACMYELRIARMVVYASDCKTRSSPIYWAMNTEHMGDSSFQVNRRNVEAMNEVEREGERAVSMLYFVVAFMSAYCVRNTKKTHIRNWATQTRDSRRNKANVENALKWDEHICAPKYTWA